MSIAPDLLRKIIEAALLAAAKPLTINQLQQLFEPEEKPGKAEFDAAFEDIQSDCADRGFELIEVANGWRFQVRQELSTWVARLWEEKPQKYSRAMLETLALVAYRQPITRGEIEEIRGVAVSSQIMKTLMERNWVKIIGHRDVPGRPAMYATTRDFLDYFNLRSLEELPTLAEIRDLDSLNQELNLEAPDDAANQPQEGVSEASEPEAPSGDDANADGATHEIDDAQETEPVVIEDVDGDTEMDGDSTSGETDVELVTDTESELDEPETLEDESTSDPAYFATVESEDYDAEESAAVIEKTGSATGDDGDVSAEEEEMLRREALAEQALLDEENDLD